MLIILYLDGGFVPGTLLLFKRNLRHWKTGCFVEILIYNFSVLFSFISLKGILSDLDLWTLYMVSATKRGFCY